MPRKQRSVLQHVGNSMASGTESSSAEFGHRSLHLGTEGADSFRAGFFGSYLKPHEEGSTWTELGGIGLGSEPGGEWQPQTVDEVLDDARRHIFARKPWARDVDLDGRVKLAPNTMKDDFHVILPDNRVQCMTYQVSKSVRLELLGLSHQSVEREARSQSRSTSRQAGVEERSRVPREGTRPVKGNTPWYLPATSWFSKQEHQDDEGSGLGFPYDGFILGTEGRYGKRKDVLEVDDPERRPLSTRDMEELQSIVDEYRKYMVGERLPHFLEAKEPKLRVPQ